MTVTLGGSQLKLEKLEKLESIPSTTLSTEEEGAAVHRTLPLETPFAPRRTFEEHLREVALKYPPAETREDAEELDSRFLPTLSLRAIADEEREAAVALSLHKDAEVNLKRPQPVKQQQQQLPPVKNINSNVVAPTVVAPTAAKVAVVGAKRPYDTAIAIKEEEEEEPEEEEEEEEEGPKFVSFSNKSASAPPPQRRSRVVDFLSAQDVETLQAHRPAVDLSRFDSDSESEGQGDGGGGGGGVFVRGKATSVLATIPQTDGANDTDEGADTTSSSSSSSDSDTSSSSSDDDDDDDDDDDGADKKKDSSSSSSSDDSSSDDDSSNASSSDDEDEEEEDKCGKKKKKGSSSSDDDDDDDDDETAAAAVANETTPHPTSSSFHQGKSPSESAAWMSQLLSAGATFFRKEPLVQIEAAWRGGREANVREFKERKRQAMRQAGKGVGNGSSGKRRKD